MKQIKDYIVEKYLIDQDTDTETFENFKKKWYNKCHNLSVSGTFRWTEPKLSISDFNDYLDDFDKAYEPSTETGYYDKLFNARYECYQAIRNGEIDKVEKIASDNQIEHFTYGAGLSTSNKELNSISNFLDCAMIFATYEYILDKKIAINMGVMNIICRFDDQFDWHKRFAKAVKQLHDSFK